MSNLMKTGSSGGARSLTQNMRRSMPNFFSDFFDDLPLARLYPSPLLTEPIEPQIRINVTDRPDEYFIRANIPGSKKENIQ